MKIALVQVTTTGDKERNIEIVAPRIREAARNGATLIVLPEAAMQAFDQGRLDTQAEELDGTFATSMRSLAQELGVTIVAGMFRPADSNGENNRVYNTALVTGPDVHKGYDKIHTYDVADYKESETVKPGSEMMTFVHEGAVVGVAICFDIRYPEQFKDLARLGAEVIVVPTSWADGEGKLEQWRTLTAARALDAGVFIVATDQARPGGKDNAGTPSGPTGIGHSVVVGPTGQRLAEAGYEEDILYAEVDPAEVAEARKAMQLL
ncbi:carbon-nitrogen hydrolase family protein [Corynebacterium sp. LK2510]|uniref:carbon-nitrogen hydrolase family protein n=1 Tax=Corynebacterium sp. LK2510 TaxID=3110472 RepID=UPI0034CF5794